MRHFIFIALLAISSAANAEIITKKITYNDGNAKLVGSVSYDNAKKTALPAIVIFPEWWGNNDYIESRAQQLAKKGYVVLAADIYGDKKSTTEVATAQSLSAPFYKNRSLMLSRARAAITAAKNIAGVDKSKIAAIGFCFGGTVALELARSSDSLNGVATFHAGLESPTKIGKDSIKTKLLVQNGGTDPMVPFAQRQAFIEEMQNANADLQFIEYAGAVHAFTNPNADKFGIDGVKYNKAAETRSFKALDGFLAEIFTK